MEFINKYTFLSWFKRAVTFAVIVAAILQTIFFYSFPNILGCAIILIAWGLTYKFVMHPLNFEKYTFSTIIIFGFCFTQFCLPIIFTLTEGKPLIYNLDYPTSVFTHSLLALLVLILSYTFYKNHVHFIRSGLQNILRKLSLFDVPSGKQFWIIGLLGIASIVIKRLVFGDANVQTDNSELLKFIDGLEPFSYLPLLLLFPSVVSESNKIRDYKVSRILIIVYILIFIVLGVMSNSRGMFMRGVVTIGLIYFLGLLVGKLDYKVFTPKNVIVASIGLWMLTGPLGDLGTAMVAVRGIRGEIPPAVLMDETVKTYKDKDALRRYKEIMSYNSVDWDENYFDNIFLARFCNLKFSDASLEQAFRMRNPDNQMQEVVFKKYLSVLPQPFLKAIDIPIEKKFYTGASFGDFLFMRNTGIGYGHFRLGNFLGVGLASFGWWYLGILFLGATLLYNFADSFVLAEGSGKYLYSVVGLLSILVFFSFFGIGTHSESVTYVFHYITREWIQTIFLYVLLFWIARKVSIIL